MVSNSTKLVSDGGTLELVCDDSGWCRVRLVVEQHTYRLGAEARHVLVPRIGRGLAEQLPPAGSGSIDGVPVCWLFSLAEGHHSVFAADSGDLRWLYFQDEKGDLAVKLGLSGAERRSWLAELDR
jgi:hypothetical protein